MSTTSAGASYRERILEQLINLRAADALPLAESDGPGGIYTWGFRAAGWPIELLLDMTVLEIRVYHGRHTIATGRVNAPLMAILVGRLPVPAQLAGASEDEALAALRAIVAHWRERNPRVFMEPPRTARHPDGWNNS